ncbi:hypothetical protein M9434_005646 [Picochlorum sp. BPE23]|nr:hypothetical protein M9434_005646 [Picochlorum sp. BPE23]
MGDSHTHTPGKSEQQAQKVRSLLQSYYSSQDKESIVGREYSEDASSYIHPEEGDLDLVLLGQADVQRHVNKLVKEKRLGELLEEERRVATEAGNADIELRNIVYESYSRFVEASSVVDDLAGALEGLDAQLHTLDSLVSRVVSQSKDIDDALNEQQRVIIDMNQSRTMLHKLALLFKVPRKMKVAVERGAYDVAVELYADAKPVLAAYSKDHAAIREISDEIEIYRSLMVESLRTKLMGESDGKNDDSVVMMLATLDEPTDSLVGIFLASQRSKIKHEVHIFIEMLEACETLHDMVGVVDSNVFHMVESLIGPMVRIFEKLFHSSARDDVVDVVREYLNTIHESIRSCVMAKMVHVVALVGGMDISGMELERPVSPEEVLNQNDPLQVEPVYLMLGTLRRHSMSLDELVPEGLAVNALHVLVGDILDSHVRAVFSVIGARWFKGVKQIMMKIVMSYSTGDDPNSYRFLKMDMKALDVQARQDFGIIQSCGMTWVVHRWIQEEWVDFLLKSIINSWSDTAMHLASLVARIVDISMDSTRQATSPVMMLEHAYSIPTTLIGTKAPLATLCLSNTLGRMSDFLQDKVKDVCKGIVLVSPNRQPGSPVSEFDHSHGPDIQATIDALGTHYVVLIKKALKDSLGTLDQVLAASSSPPLSPSTIATTLVLACLRVETDYATVGMADTDAQKPHARIWEIIEHTIMTELDMIKSLQLSKAAFQQIQVDCHLIKQQLSSHTNDPMSMTELLDRLSITAAEQCDEPILLDPIALDKIVSSSV